MPGKSILLHCAATLLSSPLPIVFLKISTNILFVAPSAIPFGGKNKTSYLEGNATPLSSLSGAKVRLEKVLLYYLQYFLNLQPLYHSS